MPGGLIQIATYGSQDLFLTGTPEITFFKIVYRRYTNFSIESVAIPFDDPVGFGATSSVIVQKIGDLMHKTYLQIRLPAINLQRNIQPNPTDAKLQYENARNNYVTLTNFMNINRRAYVAANDIYVPLNNTNNKSTNMINAVINVFNELGNAEIINAFSNLLFNTPTVPFSYEEVSLLEIVSNFSDTDDPIVIFNALSIGINKSIKDQKYYYNKVLITKKEYLDVINPNIKFGWVNRIGFAIINSIEARIGGNKIDKHYGDWMNVWAELTNNKSMDPIFNKLIGDVPIVTSYDRLGKQEYVLNVPLYFWFCRFSGLSLPFIALEYHEVSFNVNFKNIQDVAYIEPSQTIKYYNDSNGLTLDEVPAEMGVNISANFLIDFIYLDSPERRRFASSSHEYLIEQLQVLQIPNISQTKLQCILNNFVHPTKELIWTSQKTKYLTNPTGSTKLQWFNYGITDNGIGNPIIYSSIDFHSYTRVAKQHGNYFNYVQPYETHNKTPADGINMYSFSFLPEEFQPSGPANLGRLSRIALNLEFNAVYVNGETFNVNIYARNLNILRFMSGLSGLAYVYG